MPRVGVAIVVVLAVAVCVWLMRPDNLPIDPVIPARDSSSGAAPTPDVELDPAIQKRIWNQEHITFLIERHVGRAFREALEKSDAERLREFLLDTCAVELVDLTAGEIRTHAGLQEKHCTRKLSQETDSDGLIAWLLDVVTEFEKVDRSTFRVLSIRAGEDKTATHDWEVQLLLTLDGTDRSGGPRQFRSQQRVVCRVGDDAALTSEPVISVWRVASAVWRGASAPVFEEITRAVGLDQMPILDNWDLPVEQREEYRFQVAVEDFNHDGFLDIAVATQEGHPLLLQSAAGQSFENVTERLKLRRWAMAPDRLTSLAAWIDFDNDGWPDLLLGDRLYHNEAGNAFVDVTRDSGLVIDHMPMGAAVADFDLDGLSDLYVAYQISPIQRASGPGSWVGDDESGVENRLWRNLGGGRFVDVTDTAQAGGGRHHTFSASWLRWNADAYPDLYLANDFGPNVLLLNRGDGTFRDVSNESGTSDYATSMGVSTGDLNGDGIPDIYVANMYSKMGRRIIANVCSADYPAGIHEQIVGSCAGNRLYLSTGVERNGLPEYREVGSDAGVNEVGWAYGPAIADFDLDGQLDLYATCGFMSFHRDKPDG
jgi:hypothetical protein